MCTGWYYSEIFVLGMEMVGPCKRIWAGIILDYFFAAGFVMLAVAAYFIRDWMYLQIAVSSPFVLFLSYWW